jgi:biopolymer transport protein ExbB
MSGVYEIYYDFLTFFETGGEVLVLIFASTLLMWTLILERYWYYAWIFPNEVEQAVESWETREERTARAELHLRKALLMRADLQLQRTLAMIRAIVAVSPLLGLLGTVTGMIEVYDVMALAGSGNARAMAGGVSKAMITTMAGLVSALSGIIFLARLERSARNLHDALDHQLEITHDERTVPLEEPLVHSA